MIKHSTSSSNKDVNSLAELPGLLIERDSSVDRQGRELLLVVLQVSKNPSDLQCQLPGWRQNNSLGALCSKKAICSEILDNRQTKTQGLARTGQIPDNQVLPIINISKRHVLNWEKTKNSGLLEVCHSLRLNLWEISKVAWIWGTYTLFWLSNSEISTIYHAVLA